MLLWSAHFQKISGDMVSYRIELGGVSQYPRPLGGRVKEWIKDKLE